jgi:hypothetical protein
MTTHAERYVRAALRDTPTEELRKLRARALDEFDVTSAALLDEILAERDAGIIDDPVKP